MKTAALVATCVVSLFPQALHACACCGDKDWQSFHKVSRDGYDAQVLDKIRLGEGRLNYDHYSGGWEIRDGVRLGDEFVFDSEIGHFRFVADYDDSEYWNSDISFITQPDRPTKDWVDMLHQVILRGTLHLPTAAATALGRGTIESTLVLRGVGSACLEADTLRRWQLSSDLGRGWLTGGGPVQVKQK